MDLEFIEENKINKIFEKMREKKHWEIQMDKKIHWKKCVESDTHPHTHTHSMIKFKQNKIL